MTSTDTIPLVLLSERLGTATATDIQIEKAPATLRSAPLWTLQEIHQQAADASVLIVGAVEPFSAEALGGLPACQAVVRRGVGYDNVDLAAATRLGIVVANVPDASVEEVSDHALSLLLAVERRVTSLDRVVREGAWRHDPGAVQAERRGARRFAELTLGVIGLGRIGRALARKARALYHRVVACDPLVDPRLAAKLEVELMELDQLLATADHVSLHVPATAQNQPLIGAAELTTMRHGAILVNTARGGLVDETALVDAIGRGSLGGAGLDVTAAEPVGRDAPLLTADRLLVTAHSAAWSTTAETELVHRSVDAVLALLAGELPDSVVNPDVLTSPKLRISELRATTTTRGEPGV